MGAKIQAKNELRERKEMEMHFVLVHGICHGAWCWYKVAALLKSAGHRVSPLDLGASGINPKKISELTSMSDYAQPLMEFMASLPQEEKVVLVGHSFGGISISLAMERFPRKILAGVYLTAFMPSHDSPPGTRVQEFFKSVMEESLMDFQLSFDDGPENPPTGAFFGPNYMVAKVYQLSPKEDIELAKTVQRPGKWFMKDLSQESLLTKEKFGSVNRAYIVCQEDLLIKESLQKWYIEHNPPGEVKVIAGADHMPMFSKPHEIIPEKNRREISKYLFQEGVCYAKKDYNLSKHLEIDVPNLQVIKMMQSFKSKEYVRETFAWMHYYWYLTNDGIEFLKTCLNLPSEIVPATLKKQAKPGAHAY